MMKAKTQEINFDGIVGPTHNYSGLSYGNTASQKNQMLVSNPREAALQGLEKMKFLADKGITQAVLPPHERPLIPILRHLGFQGTDAIILKAVYRQSKELLFAVSSSASMWAANAATVTPSSDSYDKKVHLTPANLTSNFHRAIEAEQTATILKAIFKDPSFFIHHPPLPSSPYFSDEGAANHTRLCHQYEESGVHVFIYGRHGFKNTSTQPHLFPARQTYEASEAIARCHKIPLSSLVFHQQHPQAIDAGAFHNDVVCVGNRNIFFFHEQAFTEKDLFLNQLRYTFDQHCKHTLTAIEVSAKEISLNEAISSYLFNSQLISLKNDHMLLLAPLECKENKKIKDYLDSLVKDDSHAIKQVSYFNLHQSMLNGGGPACLRLRVVLNPEEIAATHSSIFFTEALYHQLKRWVLTHYRDQLIPDDLADPLLLIESYRALDELTKILQLGSLYPFQR